MKSLFILSVWIFLIFHFFFSALFSFFHFNSAILDNVHTYSYVHMLCWAVKNKYSIFILVVSYTYVRKRNVQRSVRNPNGDRAKRKKGWKRKVKWKWWFIISLRRWGCMYHCVGVDYLMVWKGWGDFFSPFSYHTIIYFFDQENEERIM